ncbi:hypothetical protein LJB42_001296 [Komagataella kurtzmanii]|nr:hypothetical protein LJB42_001296 [Komagataella kurtzmanii]
MTKDPQEEPSNDKPLFGSTGRKIIYDKDGKPCRSCNTLLDFKMAGGSLMGALSTKKPSLAKDSVPETYKQEPPDVEQLGKSTWTFLHSVAATYPESPSPSQQDDMRQFMNIFGKIYPCWFCAKDFQKWSSKNEPKLKTQEEFGRWLCDAHNEVNAKLGKPKFDCNLWKQRWKDGWDEGK